MSSPLLSGFCAAALLLVGVVTNCATVASAADVPTADAAPSPAGQADPALAQVPGLNALLGNYLTARNTQITGLADKYLRGLQVRLDRAADAGNLKLANAFRAEKQQVEALKATLAETPADASTAVAAPATLADLPEQSPEGLIALRATWTAERQKIREQLDAALHRSLQNLEAELTKKRDFDNASKLLAWRESLLVVDAAKAVVAAATTAAPTSAPTPAPVPAAPEKAAGEAKPIFPLPIPERPKIAGRVEVHRRDGKSLGKEDEANAITKIPEELGNRVVDVVAGEWNTQDAVIALLSDGTIAGWGLGDATQSMQASGAFLDVADVVAVCFATDKILCLKADGGLIHHDRKEGRKVTEASAEQRFVQIDRSCFTCFGLTDRGKVVVAMGKAKELPVEVPASTHIAMGWPGGHLALGSDGVWRNWTQDGIRSTKGNVSPQAISASAYGGYLLWIDENGRVFATTLTGNPTYKDTIDRSGGEGLRWESGWGLAALESTPGIWLVDGSQPDDDHRSIQRELKGASSVVFSNDKTYYFVVRPVGQ